VISCPIWLYQLWAFITPALYSKERKFAVIFVSCAGVLFLGGSVLAYAVISEGLKVLLGFGGDTTVAALSPDSYYSFLIALLLIFGVSFELPLLLIMLNQIGLISSAKLSKWRRYSIFGMVVFAGLVVPGNDPVTMLALAMALILLYELSVQVTRIHDRRAAKREQFAELADDEASALPDTGPADDRDPVPAADDGRRQHPGSRPGHRTGRGSRSHPDAGTHAPAAGRRAPRGPPFERPGRRHLIRAGRPVARLIPFGRCHVSTSCGLMFCDELVLQGSSHVAEPKQGAGTTCPPPGSSPTQASPTVARRGPMRGSLLRRPATPAGCRRPIVPIR
jgi:hypothetical protein